MESLEEVGKVGLILVRVPEMVPVRVPEIVPVRVPEMVPVRVPEMVPLLVPDMVPDFAKVVVEIAKANIATHAMDWAAFIISSYDSSVSGMVGSSLCLVSL